MAVSDFTYERIARTGFADADDEARFRDTTYERRHCNTCGTVRTHRDGLEDFGIDGLACLGCLAQRLPEPPT